MKQLDLARALPAIKERIIGLDEQVELALRSVAAGLPVMLEGESGTGKTELAKAIAGVLGLATHRVDGNQELTATKIQGWFDPPQVLERGYCWQSFIPGPLATAMLAGGLFFFNETTRAPSEALNAVLTALDEGVLRIPRLEPIVAAPGFAVVFTMNPVDRVGTNPLPRALYDRCAWIRVPHLGVQEAARIVRLRTGCPDEHLIRKVCQVVELARSHPEVQQGGSVRSVIHITRLLQGAPTGVDPYDPAEVKKCATAALAQNVRMKYDAQATAEQVIEQAVEEVFGPKKE